MSEPIPQQFEAVSPPYQAPTGRVRPRLRLPTSWLLWVVFIASLLLAGKIYFESPDFSSIPGMGEVLESHAAATEVARVLEVRVSVGQRVRIGQTMVVFDTAPIDLEITQAHDQLTKSKAQLAATTLALRRQRLSQERAFEKSIDVVDMGRISAAVEAEVDRAEAASLRLRIHWWDGLVAQKLVTEQVLIDLRAQLAGIESRIKARELAIGAWQERLSRVEKRWKDWQLAIPSADDDPEQRDLAPLKADVEVAEAGLARVEARRQHMVVRSAVDGVVSRVLMQPGDVATPGQTVVVLRPPEVRRVIAYALDTVARRLRVGASVEVQRRDGTGRMLKAHIEGFGGVAAIPLQLQSVPVRAPLAAEEIVVVLEEGSLLPGEPVDVAFLHGVLGYPVDRPSEAAPLPAIELPHPATQATALPVPATPTTPPPGPSVALPPVPTPSERAAELLEIPDQLRAISRLEPSGLLWLPERQKYLVVSDDTGLPEQNDHAPWVFEVDAGGHVAPKPLILENGPEISDLESVTRAADGTLWLLTSQSVSRKGKRTDARCELLRAHIKDGRVIVDGHALLGAAMGRLHDPAWLDSLGLAAHDPLYRQGAAGFDRTLDVEGMAVDGDGLLLALKRPLDAQGRAILWRLAHPERLIATGHLLKTDLTVWARVPLQAGPPSAGMAAGIADILFLPDGRLALLATALGDADEGHGDVGLHSALYVAGRPGTNGLLQPQLLRRIAGYHAEGMALEPDGKGLRLILDENTDLPHWLHVPLP